MVKKLMLTIAYDGTNFIGWQRQNLPHAKNRSVQGELERALKKLFKRPIILRGAGRTDSGVHAVGQTAAFECPIASPALGVQLALNSLLPADIRIVGCEDVGVDFHPRYDAVAKTYCYYLAIGREPTVFNCNRSYFSKHSLATESMAAAAKMFEGLHQFESFTAKGNPVASYEKEIFSCKFQRCLPQPANLLPWQDIGQCWQLQVTGSGFMYKMVRLMMGSLIHLGRGKLTVDEIQLALNHPGGIIAPPAPACGLYLQKVFYPPHSFGSGGKP